MFLWYLHVVMSKVFISYVSQDSSFVDRLVNVLKNNGLEVWLDRSELLPGIKWKLAIAQAIQEGTFFLSVHSKARAERDRSYVNEELAIAIEEIRKRPFNKPWLIPLKIDKFPIEERPIGGGETLLDLQYCDLSDWENGISELLRALGVKKPSIKESKTNKHKKGFVAPLASAEKSFSALKSFQSKFGSNKSSRDEVEKEFGEPAIQDLVSLGLLQADFRDRTVRLVNPDGNQEVAIVAAISAQRSFQIGISLLEANMNVSAKEIGGAISKALGRDWSEGSRKRYGHAIRSWILRFYPNLRPPIPG
ncbi:MAG: toll/interleukin-1 receptor domain-containing protein [Myxococcota bacterium]